MKITDAESIVMMALWEGYPATSDEIISRLDGEQKWKRGTVKALINRLLKKGAVTSVQDGRRFLYSPEISKDEFLFRKSHNLVEQLFSGRLAPFVSHFSERKKLKKSDIQALKEIISRLDDGT